MSPAAVACGRAAGRRASVINPKARVLGCFPKHLPLNCTSH
jgi:hypothetical protein